MIRKLAVFVLVLGSNALALAADTLPTYISSKHREVLQNWLNAHAEFRLALDADCSCENDIEKMRLGSGGPWKPQPNFHPFYVAGDFDSDGREDFAVVLLKGSDRFVAVFNNDERQPAYLGSSGFASLFFGPPRPKPYRLLLGNFWSEGVSFKPAGSGYILQ